MAVHEGADEDKKEHANYTPQTDMVQTTEDEDGDTVVMDSTGILDLEGCSVHSSSQIESAVHSLQGAMYVPHGSLPVTDYNNPVLWIGAFPWLFSIWSWSS